MQIFANGKRRFFFMEFYVIHLKLADERARILCCYRKKQICHHFLAHALNTLIYRGVLGARANLDTKRCVWIGEFDLNTLRVDGEKLNSERKSCGFKTS